MVNAGKDCLKRLVPGEADWLAWLQRPMFEPIIIVLLFAAAWLLARASAWVAVRVLMWNDRRHAETDLSQAGRMARLKRRETQVSVVRAGITYVAFGTAAVLSVGQLLGGVDRLTALAGA